MREYLIHACHTESSSSAPEELISASVPELLASRRCSRRLNFKQYPPNVLLMRRCIRPLHLLLASFTVLRLYTARKHPSLYFASSSPCLPTRFDEYKLKDGAGVYGLPSAACLVVCDRFMFLYDSSICFNCIGL